MSVRMKTYVVHMVNVSIYQLGTIVTVRLTTTLIKSLEGVKVSCTITYVCFFSICNDPWAF